MLIFSVGTYHLHASHVFDPSSGKALPLFDLGADNQAFALKIGNRLSGATNNSAHQERVESSFTAVRSPQPAQNIQKRGFAIISQPVQEPERLHIGAPTERVPDSVS